MIRSASRLLVLVALAPLVACQTQTGQAQRADQAAPAGGSSPPATTAAAPAPGAAPASPSAASPTPVPSPATPGQEPQPKPAAEASTLLLVSVARANMRAGPDTNSRILAVLTRGTKLTVISRGNQWYRVRLDNGTEGWVAESVVTPAP